MPYELFRKDRLYCTRNKRTGNVTCYSSEEKREKGIQRKEMFSHWRPKGLAAADSATRYRVSSKGGRSRKR